MALAPTVIPGVEEETAVAAPSLHYMEMAERWELISDLLGGTLQMRAKGKTWLPIETAETEKHYQVRLSRSFLYGAYKDTVDKIVAKPFSRMVEHKGNANLLIDESWDNVDMLGSTITKFVEDCFYDMVNYGMTHVLIDQPSVKAINLKQALEQDVRPFLVHVPASNLIGFRYRHGTNGKKILTQVRIKETSMQSYGEFSEKLVEMIRVWTETEFKTYVRVEGEENFTIDEEKSGVNELGFIPLVTMYTNKTGFMKAEPPLEDLAWLNLAHWQSLSDQRNILRFARTGLLFLKGITQEEYDDGITLGPTQMVRTTSTEADMKYVEHSGAAITAGERDLLSLEERMQVLGLQPMIEKTGNTTAFGRGVDESRNQAKIHLWIQCVEEGFNEIYKIVGVILGTNLDTTFKLYKDFYLSMKSAEQIRSLILMRQAGEISRETFLRELNRRDILSDDFDIEAEMEALDKEMEAIVQRERAQTESKDPDDVEGMDDAAGGKEN